ncbi:hypothetical protein PQI51_03275 [Microbacterium esteraromaticum]|uniref:hypothetical protein n=1 Tax=Microbacterium esteraromaticum TaxID=57043 RepID=UPI0030972658
MNREELIGLRKQIQKVIEDGRAFPADVLSAQIVLVFEQAHTPTDTLTCTHPGHGKRLHECELPPIEPQGEPSDAEGSVRRLKESGVGAYMILAAVTKVYDMGVKR